MASQFGGVNYTAKYNGICIKCGYMQNIYILEKPISSVTFCKGYSLTHHFGLRGGGVRGHEAPSLVSPRKGHVLGQGICKK